MTTTETGEGVRRSRAWMAVLAAVSLIGGILALINPFAATLAATLMAGWAFILLGALQIVHAFRVRRWRGFLWELLFGVLTFMVGIVILFDPLAGMVSLTLLMAIAFLILGVIKVMYALSLRPHSGWGWGLVSGVLSLLIGVMVLANFPWAAATVLGILLGVELISTGVLFLLMAFGPRRA